MNESPDVDAAVERLEALLDELERDSGPLGRERAGEIVSLLMKLYGASLERVVQMAGESPQMLDRLAADRLLASLLLLHGLHPETQEARVREALERVERRLGAQHVVLEGLGGGVARIRIDRNGGSSPWPPDALAAMIERAVMEAAPDLEAVEIRGLEAVALVQIAPRSV